MLNIRSAVLSVLFVLCMLAGPVGAASAAGSDRMLAATSVTDATGGAAGRVELWQRGTDGAVLPKVWVSDTRADGVCAHAAIQWLHRNGNVYTDYGSWICGAGTGSSEPSVKGARNWRDYRSVSIAAFVDGGPTATAAVHDFIASPPGVSDPPQEPPAPERVTVRKCGPKIELRALVTLTAATGGHNPSVPDTAGGEYPIKEDGVNAIGSVQSCVEKTRTHLFARTWVDLDGGWKLNDDGLMRVCSALVDQRTGATVGEAGQFGLKSNPGRDSNGAKACNDDRTCKRQKKRCPSDKLTARTDKLWFVTRARGGDNPAQFHGSWNDPGSVYVFESEPVRRTARTRARFYTTRSSFDFAKKPFKNTWYALVVYWGDYGPRPTPEGDRGFYQNEMSWGGGFVPG